MVEGPEHQRICLAHKGAGLPVAPVDSHLVPQLSLLREIVPDRVRGAGTT